MDPAAAVPLAISAGAAQATLFPGKYYLKLIGRTNCTQCGTEGTRSCGCVVPVQQGSPACCPACLAACFVLFLHGLTSGLWSVTEPSPDAPGPRGQGMSICYNRALAAELVSSSLNCVKIRYSISIPARSAVHAAAAAGTTAPGLAALRLTHGGMDAPVLVPAAGTGGGGAGQAGLVGGISTRRVQWRGEVVVSGDPPPLLPRQTARGRTVSSTCTQKVAVT